MASELADRVVRIEKFLQILCAYLVADQGAKDLGEDARELIRGYLASQLEEWRQRLWGWPVTREA